MFGWHGTLYLLQLTTFCIHVVAYRLRDSYEIDEAAQTGSLLMEEARTLSATDDSQETSRKYYFASTLATQGFHLSNQFQLFVLKYLVERGLVDEGHDESEQLDHSLLGVATSVTGRRRLEPPSDSAAEANLNSASQPVTDDAGEGILIDGAQSGLAVPREPTEEGRRRRRTETVAVDIDIDLKPGNRTTGVGMSENKENLERIAKAFFKVAQRNISHDEARQFLIDIGVDPSNYDIRAVESRIASVSAIDLVVKNLHNKPDFSGRPLSETNPAAYLEWRKRNARKKHWLVDFSPQGSTGEAPDELYMLSDEVEALSVKIEDFDRMIKVALSVDWATVRGDQRSVTLLRRLSRRGYYWIRGTLHNMKTFVMHLWRLFVNDQKEAEKACSQSMHSDLKAKATGRGVLSGNALVRKVNGANVMTIAEDQVRKSEKIITSIKRRSLQDLAQNRTDRTDAMNSQFQQIEKDARNGIIKPVELKQSLQMLDNVQKENCRMRQAEVADRARGALTALKSLLRSAKVATKSTIRSKRELLKRLIPQAAQRGVEASGGPLTFGFEEVVDFTNREIGYFSSSSRSLIPSLHMLGFGSFVGLGWKQYKVNWTLQEAYQTGMSYKFSMPSELNLLASTLAMPGLQLFGTAVGLGASFSIDADNSVTRLMDITPYVAEPQGFVGVAIHGDVGFKMSPELLGPLGQIGSGLDKLSAFSQKLSAMFTSECFRNGKSFLRAILDKRCLSCDAGREFNFISALRLGTWAGSFPVISDIIFFTLWAINETARRWKGSGKTYHSHCSWDSTNQRKNPKYIIDHIAHKLDRLRIQIEMMRNSTQALDEKLTEAVKTNQEDLLQSPEYRKLLQDISSQACHASPEELQIGPIQDNASQSGKPVDPGLEERFKMLGEAERAELCEKHYGRLSCEEEELRRASSFASDTHPFGTCTDNTQCSVLIHGECQKEAKRLPFIGLWKKQYGRCKCKPGYCYQRKQDTETCVRFQLKHIRQYVRPWFLFQEMELASLLEKLVLLMQSRSS